MDTEGPRKPGVSQGAPHLSRAAPLTQMQPQDLQGREQEKQYKVTGGQVQGEAEGLGCAAERGVGWGGSGKVGETQEVGAARPHSLL